jgi:hypothetical protein
VSIIRRVEQRTDNGTMKNDSGKEKRPNKPSLAGPGGSPQPLIPQSNRAILRSAFSHPRPSVRRRTRAVKLCAATPERGETERVSSAVRRHACCAAASCGVSGQQKFRWGGRRSPRRRPPHLNFCSSSATAYRTQQGKKNCSVTVLLLSVI